MASTSSSSTQKSFKYDVFLSFRGGDTRNNFVGHLYEALQRNSIETYKDDKKIEQGKPIKDQLTKSIEDSRFYIIVFSKTYASSSWCLDELVKIMECKKTTEQNVYPVFFDVEPTEVRKQSGAVKEAFTEHEKKEAAEKWREAMEEASNLAGWELKTTANGDESKLIQIIVDVIFKKKYSTLSNADGKLVGMETRISDILSSLEIGTEDVRMIGIKGMGGGGKTTLARAVYDRISTIFEGKSFIENVREVSQPSLSGLKKLQKRILKDVLNKQDITFSSVHDGKNMLKATMRCRKILVVLDDVDRIEQLEALAGELDWFKSGSRIIITTRDEQVLRAHGVKFVHDVNLLSPTEAICLLSRYAFEREIPTRGYEELSGQVVRYAAGLPLTIKVLGSFLRGVNEHEWKDALERLKTIPHQDTQKILKITYDALEPDLKDIFLDVACVLKGEQKDKAIVVLESCGFRASIGLSVLEKKSLVTISMYGSLGMHDRIEEMGKSMKQSNVSNCHQRLDLRTFMTGLRNMKKLRVLYICSGSYWDDSNVSQLFPSSLKYLCWRAYPFSSLHETFQADNLVGLDMSFSTKLQLWLVGKGKALTKLRFLDLSYTGLRRLNLGLTPNLESLDLKECRNLVEVNAPVGCLKNLLYMDLSGCGIMEVPKDLHHLLHLEELYLSKTKIKYLPDSICMLKQLKSINLEDCHNLEKLPDDFGQLDSLEELILSNSKIKHLPDSVCMLKQLKSLKLQGCGHLEKLPEGFGQLECLKELNITGTAISHLPRYIFGLKGVRIIGSKMMLGSFGFTSEIQSSDHKRLKKNPFKATMERLEISFDGLEDDCKEIFLDVACILKGWGKEDAIRVLESRGFHAEVGLRVLEQKSLITMSEKNWEGKLCLGMHDHLEEMGRNIVRRSHPDEPQRHSRLWVDEEIKYILTNDLGTQATKCLSLRSPGFSAEIAVKGLAKMKDLRFIHIKPSYECNWKFDKDSEYLPSSLRYMRWFGFPFPSLPNTFQGKHLVGLEIVDSKIVQLWEDGEEKVLHKLRFLTFHYCSKLQTFDLRLAPNLEQLTLDYCDDFVELHMPAESLKLEHLDLSHSKLKTLHLGNTPNLKTLDLQGYSEYLPSSLRYMRWFGFPFPSLPNTFQGKHLVGLEIVDSKIVQLWEDGEEKVLHKLRFLTFHYCSKLQTFDLRLAPNLEQLTLDYCDDFVELHMPAESLKLEHLDLSHSKLKTLHLGNTPNLKTLDLQGCSDLVELQMPAERLKLEHLDLSHSKLTNLHLGNTPNLKILVLKGCNDLVELQMPAERLKLEYINFSDTKLKTLDLGLTPNLEWLKLKNCYDLVEINAPIGCGRFKSFEFDNLSELAEACSLSELHLIAEPTDVCPLHSDNDSPKFRFECYYKENPVSSFGNLERLISIGLCACTNFESFSRSICSLEHLRKLKLEGSISEAPKDLDRLECLEELTFSSTGIKHLPDSICKLKHLKSFKIKSCWLLEKLPEDIGRLESLEKLILTDCELLQDVPNSICKMKCINSFDLRGCIRVVKLPEDIGCLECLKELDIEGTGISHLPQSIFQLRGLRIVGRSDQQEAFVNQRITVNQVNSDRDGEQEANATQLRR
ncbi:disease resistance protein (TIR-NBS-LRR class) [Artemisia annua]|uniref:Disease resistance protein (TIR-NBS-LRR class) n=1 Tax=Artemisia annua TaxID=35608 RepID=A0A2U1PSP0_ARTAN|nr:disease resistance protein (TIR-NBS-LRR class) [Artemisia annua]